MNEQSLIKVDVDYNQDGKQFGYLSVPQSTNSAGWSKYMVPIVVLKNGDGPTGVLFGANHGDESEGTVTLLNLGRELDPGSIAGRIIMIPMLNHPAVRSGTRLSPIDGVNMNRAFPGHRNDSITGMIAHYVTQSILPLADIVIDIHSGGSSMHMLPSVNMHRLDQIDQMNKMIEAGFAWGAPYLFLYRDVAGEGLLPSLAESMGKVTLGTEMGSKAQFGVETLSTTRIGVRNVLHWAGILNEPASVPDTRKTRLVAADDEHDYVMAPVSGLFEPFRELGDAIQSGQAIGQLHDIERPERSPFTVHAQSSGICMSRRSIPLTLQGECVMVVVRDVAH